MNNVQPKTEKGVRASLEGWPITHPKNMVVYEICKRCDEKNEVRREYGMETEDEDLAIGDRVRGFVCYDEDKGVWELTAVFHERHPLKDREEVAEPNTPQAQIVAKVGRRGWTYENILRGDDDRPDYHFVDDQATLEKVTVEWLSPEGEGEESEPYGEYREELDQYIITPADPWPWWPEEEQEWHNEIKMRHGDPVETDRTVEHQGFVDMDMLEEWDEEEVEFYEEDPDPI